MATTGIVVAAAVTPPAATELVDTLYRVALEAVKLPGPTVAVVFRPAPHAVPVR